MNEGYSDEGGTCVPTEVDLCDPNPCDEPNRSVCTLVNGQPECSCDDKHHEEAGACVTDETSVCSPNPCTTPHKTVCTAGASGPLCSCDEGSEPAGEACVPVASDPCDPNPCTAPNRTTCAVLGGQASCSCDPGYVPDGSACVTATCSGGKFSDTIEVGDKTTASSPAGLSLSVWTGRHLAVLWDEDRLGQGTEIDAAKLSAEGVKSGSDLRLTAAPGDSALYLNSVVPTAGGFAMAWSDGRYSASGHEVVFARFDEDLVRVGSEQRVTAGSKVTEVALAALSEGFLVAWAEANGGLWAQLLDRDGAPNGQPVMLTLDNVYGLSVASSGAVHGVVWVNPTTLTPRFVVLAGDLTPGEVTSLSGKAEFFELFWTGSAFSLISVTVDGEVPNTVRLSSFDTAGIVSIDSVAIASGPDYWDMSAAWTGSKFYVLLDTKMPDSSWMARLHDYDVNGVALNPAQDLHPSGNAANFVLRAVPNGVVATWLRQPLGSDGNIFLRRWCE